MEDAVEEIARIAAKANASLENIGARRLRTVMSKVMEEIKFEADKCQGAKIPIDLQYIKAQLGETMNKTDLQRYVL
jgi:ATP-dependent HslUV protease ATP-binding subunit HslU